MKKFFFVLSVVSVFFMLSASVFAGSAYITPQIAISMLEDATLSEPGVAFTVDAEFDTGYGVGLAAGYDFGAYRVEGEIDYKAHDIESFSALGVGISGTGEISALSVFVNGYIDFENNTVFTPYLGAGIGFSTIDVDNAQAGGIVMGSEDDTVFAYQLMAGFSYAFTESMALDLSYRYFATSDPEFGITEAEYASHNVYLGLRFGF
ncbi:MAG: outer membrane beta-barrel protein [Syntrophales bacterium]|jgi:opacity protein-like surface antigen|nr:outer membrane beta-barrel protein [Syntrophales bacterium]MDY0045219.1 outer membrane beta-barrel protein [Syntrophales bacterium]